MDDKKLTAEEIDTIGEIMNISMGAAATAVSTMLERQVAITTPSIEQSQLHNIDCSSLEPAIVVTISYIEGISGTSVIILRRNDMRIILDLLMGNDFTETDDSFEFDEMSMSAACEVMNQMMGASATALSEVVGKAVNISTPTATLVETNEQLMEFLEGKSEDTDDILDISFKLLIKETLDTSFSSIMPLSFVRELVHALNNEMGEDMEQDAPQPVPEPAPASQPAIPQQGVQPPVPQAAPQPPVQPPVQQAAPQQEVQPPVRQAAQAAAPQQPVRPPVQQAPPQPVVQQVPAQQQQPYQQPVVQQPQFQQPYQQPIPEQYAYGMPQQGQPGAMPYQQPYQQPYMQSPYPPQYGGYPEPHPNVRYTSPVVSVKQADFPEFAGTGNTGAAAYPNNMNMLMGVNLEVSVIVGRAKQKIKDVLEFGQGSVIELDKQTGSPAEIMVNGQLLAYGDVVVVGDNFGVRITEIVGTKDLLDSLDTKK